MADTDKWFYRFFRRVYNAIKPALSWLVKYVAKLLEKTVTGPFKHLRDVLLGYKGDESRNIALMLGVLALVVFNSRDLPAYLKSPIFQGVLLILGIFVVSILLDKTNEGRSERIYNCEYCDEEYDEKRKLNIHKGHMHKD